jgi:aconitate hydratase
MKYRSNVPKYSEFVFEIVDSTFHDRASEIRDKGMHNIIVGGESYGQGSSREHAALCPMYLGVKAVLAKSLERIHTANLINFGIVPLLFKNPADYDKIEQGDELRIENIRGALEKNKPIKVLNKSKGVEIPVEYKLSDRHRAIILAGGTLNYMGNK